MIKKLIIILLFINITTLLADVIVPGGTIDTTWTKAKSPYRITGNVNVINLIIEPGVEVLFEGDYRFEVNGILIAKGFYSDSIYFKPYVTNPNGWQGILFNNCFVSSELLYCSIEGANNYGIRVNDCIAPLISNCKFSHIDGNGLYLRRSEIQINQCIFKQNTQNGISVDNGLVRIRNSIFSDNDESGILSINALDSLYITNSVIADNLGTGINSVAGYVNILNSIIYYNNIDISSQPSRTVVTFSDVGDVTIIGTGNIYSEPNFLNHINYLLSNSSLCIDQGHTSSIYYDIYFPPSLGNERNDMGAYGGPLAGNWFPPLFIQPDSLDFGQVSYDSSMTLTLSVKNYRDSTIVVNNIKFSGNDTSVFYTDTDSLNINILDSAHINVTFTPDRQALFVADLELETIKYGEIYVPLQGEGIVAEISIPQNNLDFGLVDLGTSHELFIQVINSGLDTLRLSQISTTNPAFTVSDSSLKVNPGPTLDLISVTFTPDSIDIKTDSLIILNNDPDEGRIAIPLYGQGSGPIINLNNKSLDFGSVYFTRDSMLNVSINNNGNDSLYIHDIQVLKNDTISNSFRLLNDSINFPLKIEADSTYNLGVRFEPTVLGIDSAIIVIQNNDVFMPKVSIDLIGSGIAAFIELNQTMIDFGIIPFNTSAVDSIVIKNIGNSNLIIEEDSLIFSGTHTEFFDIDSISSTQIDPGDSAIMFISFEADSEGVKQAVLQVVSNDPFNRKDSVQLSGESWAPEISVSDTVLKFGEVLKDSISYLSTYICNNGQGDLLLFEDSLTISGSESNYFHIESIDTCVIGSSDTSEIIIRFEAEKPAENHAELNIISNDPDSNSIQINLSAVVLIPFIDTSHSIIDFGSIPLFTEENKKLAIYNVGYEPLTIYLDSLKITGTDSQFFSIDSIPADSIIQPEDSAKILLRYSALDIGTKNATLNIRSDDRVLPLLQVSLTGSSDTPQIELSNEEFDFGIIPFETDTSVTLIIRNNGQGNLILYKEGFFLKDTGSHSFYVDTLDSDVTVNPQDSIAINVELITTNVGPKSDTLQILCNDYNDSLRNVPLKGLIIDNKPASVSLDSHSSSELIYHQNGNLRFIVITNNFPTDSVLLNFRQGGAVEFDSVQCTDLAQMNLWEITIDSSWITTKGFEYYVRVYHGWTTTDWPERPKSLPVRISEMEFPEATKKEVYQKISIPFHTSNQTLNDLFGDNLGSYDNTNYRIFDCENGIDYTEITNLNKKLPPGKSLWVITKNEVNLDITNAKTLHTDSTFQLSLDSGWNMISTPFAFPINWDENDDKHQLRFYDGSDWKFVYVLEPFKGYAVKVKSDTIVNIQPNEYTGANVLAKEKLFTEIDWSVNLKIEQNKLRDHFNFAGTKNNAFDSIDRYDYPEPPPIGNFISLYFMQQNDITRKNEKFSTDFRDINAEGYIYDFEVIGNVSGKKSLLIETSSLPEDFRYVIINPESKIKYEIGNIDLYSNNNKLQLIVGFEEFVNAQTVEYNFAPATFKLDQNYPNPFNPSTIIKYQIPKFTKISIDIYNILGQKVRSLINNEAKDAGYYQVSWDGKNNSGNIVATSIYFLNFRSSQFSKSIKMLLQR